MRPDIVVETGLTDEQRAMTEANLGLIGLVVDLNQHLVSELYDQDDAWQDGFFGLARAVQLFDPTRGFRFSTYAFDQIRHAIQKGRGRAESKAWRAAYDRNEARGFEFPYSYDLPAPGADDGTPIIDLLESSGDDPAEEALANVVLDAVRDACADRLDRDLVEAMVEGGSFQAAATANGYAHGSTSKRVVRLRDIAAAQLA